MARAPGWASKACATCLAMGKPGRRYASAMTSSPYTCLSTSWQRSLLVSDTMASAWVWITAGAGRNPWSGVSMEGRGLAGSRSAWAK